MIDDKTFRNINKALEQIGHITESAAKIREVLKPLQETAMVMQKATEAACIPIVNITKGIAQYERAIGRILEQNSRMASNVAKMLSDYQRCVIKTEDYLNLNYEKIVNAVISTLEELPEDAVSTDEIIRRTAEAYEIETPEEKEAFAPIIESNEEGKEQPKTTQVSFIVQLIIAIISNLICVPINNALSNDPQIINQYYIQNITNIYVEEGYDTDLLDFEGYRIVNRETEVYQTTHPTKGTVGSLKKGSIAHMLHQYKKWIEIEWQDDTGWHCGWIQNYKLERFANVEERF